MSDGNWIKFHRKIVKWEWYKNSNMVHLFIHLIATANWTDGRWKGVPILKGQLPTGRKSLSEATGIGEQSIRTCLKRLVDSGEITIEPTSRFSMITICNYEEYQSTEPASNQRPTSVQPASNQQVTSWKPNEGNGFSGSFPEEKHRDFKKTPKSTTLKEGRSKKKEVKKNTYGVFQNVFLQEKEKIKLDKKFNGQCEDKIDTLSEYMKSINAKKYKDHYATILSWDRRDKKRKSTYEKPKRQTGYAEPSKTKDWTK